MVGGNRILLVDNDQFVLKYLEEKLMVEAGYSVIVASSARSGLETFRQSNFDLVVAKYGLPDLDGTRFVRELKTQDPDCVILCRVDDNTAGVYPDSLHSLGVYDCFSKPVNLEKFFFLVKKGIELHLLMVSHRRLGAILKEQNISLQKQNLLLAKRIDESTRNLTRLYEDLRSTYMRTIRALAQAIDARDHYTHSHSENVSKIAVAIAQEMGLSTRDAENIRQASELHDLGKIGVEDRILTKPSGLNAEEWEQIKRHPQTGAQILEPLTFLSDVIELVRQHHEHYDGTGYPKGLKGEEILLGAQIIHLADAYETMRSERAYRKMPLTKEEAVEEIKSKSGLQFAPKVTEAFLKVVDRL